MKPFFVYILKCSDESYYTGHTDDIEKRLNEHKTSISKCYTSKRLPFELVFNQSFPTRVEALVAERKIKGWSRKKKEALIESDWGLIKELSKKEFM